MKRVLAILLLIPCLSVPDVPAIAGGESLAGIFPATECVRGWTRQDNVVLYDRETLFDRIDGEAELYFPYGFKTLASARYADRQNPRTAVDADVYEMGSLLDAFGIYANYRRREDPEVEIGAGGTVNPSQLIFYQGNHFVRLQASGAAFLGREIFLACARAISRNLPAGGSRPSELDVFSIPEVVRRSERYIARSLLGYDFFRRGLVADAVLEGETGRVFLVIEDSPEAASRALDRYRSYLESSGKGGAAAEAAEKDSLAAVDPLYGSVRMEREGRYLFGALRFAKPSAARRLIERLRGVRDVPAAAPALKVP